MKRFHFPVQKWKLGKKSFEPLIDFLVFQVQNYGLKTTN